MDRNIAIGNRIIGQKMHSQERKRHLSRLEEIRGKRQSSPYHLQNVNPHATHSLKQKQTHLKFFRQSTTSADYSTPFPTEGDKNLQIQRKNIFMFNRIASIIKQRPKIQFPKTRHFVKTIGEALSEHQKKQLQIRSQNQLLEKRIKQQKPTIQNTLIFKDRLKNIKYLKLIGKYPFNPNKKIQTEPQNQDIEAVLLPYENNPPGFVLFQEKSLDFEMKISFHESGAFYVFNIIDLLDSSQYQLQMDIQQFKKQYIENQMSFFIMMGRLRINKKGTMVYQSERGKHMRTQESGVSSSKQIN